VLATLNYHIESLPALRYTLTTPRYPPQTLSSLYNCLAPRLAVANFNYSIGAFYSPTFRQSCRKMHWSAHNWATLVSSSSHFCG